MRSPVETEFLRPPAVSARASGVESNPGQAKETTALMGRRNLLTLFDDFARFASDVAVVQTHGYRREKLTYAELSSRAKFWSRALAGQGMGHGDRVLLWGANSGEWVACFWGILLRGA